jgi:hypothetical protein
MTTFSRRERWIQALLALMLFTSYAYFLPRRVDWNQNGRMDLVLAIVDRGELIIDAYQGNTGDYAHFGAHYFSDKAPGTSFLGLPFYWAFRVLAHAPTTGRLLARVAAGAAPGSASAQELEGLFPWRGYFALALYVTTLGAVALPSTLRGVLLYRLARQLKAGAGNAAALTLIYGLGTTAFPYGGALYGHMLAAACLFGAFYLLWMHRRGAGWLLFAGFLLGWAVITEYPMALPAGLIGLYAISQLRDRRVWVVVGGGVVPILVLAVYDMAIYGTPLPVGYNYSELWLTEHSTGFMSLTGPTLERLWGVTFSPYRGLFFLSPVLLFAIPGFIRMFGNRERRAEWWTLLMCGVIVILFNASSVMWWGGFAVGARYAAPAIPFLVVPIAAWLASARRWRRVFLGAGVVSIASVWAQTVASVRFYPPEMYRFPLIEFAWPALQSGQIALNLGTAVGLLDLPSLAPLGVFLFGSVLALVYLCRPAGGTVTCIAV